MALPSDLQRARKGRRLSLWLAVAAFIHVEALAVLGLILHQVAPRDADVQRRMAEMGFGDRVEIGMVDEDAARQIIADLERQAEKAKQEKIEKEIESRDAPGQVVEIPRPREERRPDDARYVSEYDSTVAHETKRHGAWKDDARQGDAEGSATLSRKAVAAEPATRPQPPSPLAMRSPGGRRLVQGGIEGAPGQRLPEMADGSLPQAGGQPGARGGTPRTDGDAMPSPPLGALMPSEQQLARAIGGGTMDALKDVDDGDETALNSKKWKFASFFNRMKRQVQQHWHPDEAYQRRDPTGNIYGHQDRLTILRVSLKPDGTLAGVNIEKPSGVEFLDDEAITAFKQAQPFPNPPRQLVGDGGLINFRFGFLLELSSAPRMRMFRYDKDL